MLMELKRNFASYTDATQNDANNVINENSGAQL